MCIRDRTRDKLALFREKLRRAYPDKRYPFTRKLPQLLFAGTFRKGELKEYNGWILLEINRLKSIEEALSLKQKIVEYPQTLFAMIGSSGRSVKFVVAYTYPDGSLPRSRTDAEVFHAHAYRHALKTYEPRLSYPIELKRPVLEIDVYKRQFLNHVNHTSNGLDYLKQFAGPNYTGESLYINEPAVRAGNIITANGFATLEFCREILYALEADSSPKIERSYRMNKTGVWEDPEVG